MPPTQRALDAVRQTLVELANDEGELQGTQPLAFQILEKANAHLAETDTPGEVVGWYLGGSDQLFLYTCFHELDRYSKHNSFQYDIDGYWFWVRVDPL